MHRQASIEPSLPFTRSQRRVGWLVAAVTITLGGTALALLVWAVASVFLRQPLYSEAMILFNASRIREGLPLYVPAVIGAHEYGEPPARYWVAYTPVYATILAAIPSAAALVVARLLGLFAWYAALIRSVLRARPGDRARAAIAALFLASIYRFMSEAASAKPDALALLVVVVALDRVLDRRGADARAGLLFALAALIKPSVFGAAIGALAASSLVTRRIRGSLAAAATLATAFAGLQLATGGLGLSHLRAAVALEFQLELAQSTVPARFVFVAGLIALAALGAWQARRDASARIGLAALASSIVVAAIGFGKVGASTNYLMEPSLVSLLLICRFRPQMPRRLVSTFALASALGVTFVWSTNASIRSLAGQTRELGSAVPALERIRGRCAGREGEIVLSSDPGTELVVNGRLHSHPIELTAETMSGRFPEPVWVADVQHPNVRCYVAGVGDDGAPPRPPGSFPPAVADALRERFVLSFVDSGYAVYETEPRTVASPSPARQQLETR